MTIECYKSSCYKHSCHYDKEAGPFCDENECIESPFFGGESRPGPDPESLTCFGCSQRDICKYVDDWYNTDGDCLASK